jgi:hypothetical protein
MKSILYVGATLMIGASIYGFVDYKQTQGKKEFKEMYVEEKRTAPVVAVENAVAEPAVKKEVVKEKKSASKKKLAAKEEEPYVIIEPIAEDELMENNEIKAIEKTTVDITASKDSDTEKKVVKKKKKLNTRLFSRAPLREREEVNPVEPPTTNVKKTDNKE